MFSLPSWFGLRKLYFSRNLFIFSRSLILLCIIACHNLYDPSYFCSVTCNFSFIFYFIYLGLLFFFSYLVWIEFYKFCLTFQNQLLASLIFWNYFCLYFIYFCSDLYYFFPYTNFGLCSFFLVPFGVRQIWDFFFFLFPEQGYPTLPYGVSFGLMVGRSRYPGGWLEVRGTWG